MFLGGNQKSDREAKPNRRKIGKVKDKNRFFEDYRANIKPAARQKRTGNKEKPGIA